MSNTGGYSNKGSDGFVYRVTREEAVVDYSHPDFTWQMPYKDYPKHWIRRTKLCSKRSAAQQVRHLVDREGGQRYVHERLISVERAPYEAFEDVTSSFTGGDV